MEGFVTLAILFIVPVALFIKFYLESYFCENKKLHKKKIIITNVALLIYLVGIFTPISNVMAIAIVYLIFLFLIISKKHILKILIFAIILTNGVVISNDVTYAFETKESEYEEAVEMLKKTYGMDDFLVSKLEERDVIEIAKKASENPECIEVSKSTNVIDNIESIENAVNLDETQLMELCGLDKTSAKQIKMSIAKQRELSDNELKTVYSLSDAEVKIFRNALMEQDGYVPQKECKREVTLSATISSSYLSYYDLIINECKDDTIQYHVMLGFDWLKPCWNSFFEDTIAVSWGGELNYKGVVTKNVNYRTFTGIYPLWKFSSNVVGSEEPRADLTAGKGVKYSFPQMHSKPNLVETRVKNGLIEFEIKGDTKQNKTTQIVSKYCHRIINIASVSITLTGPGIDASAAYECTDDDDNWHDIKY